MSAFLSVEAEIRELPLRPEDTHIRREATGRRRVCLGLGIWTPYMHKDGRSWRIVAGARDRFAALIYRRNR